MVAEEYRDGVALWTAVTARAEATATATGVEAGGSIRAGSAEARLSTNTVQRCKRDAALEEHASAQ